jgi:hypothetical protein
MKIYKYEIKTYQRAMYYSLPEKLLHLGVQGDKIYIWGVSEPLVDYEIVCLGTGIEALKGWEDPVDHLGTVQMGEFVIHVFARRIKTVRLNPRG